MKEKDCASFSIEDFDFKEWKDVEVLKKYIDEFQNDDTFFIFQSSNVYLTGNFSERYYNVIKEKIINKDILDLFCGNGYVGIRLSERNKKVDCADCSNDALRLTRINKYVNDIDNINCLKSNVFSNITNNMKYDAITAIPPMMSSAKYDNYDWFESEDGKPATPREAYDAGEDELKYYKILLRESFDHLNPNGKLYLPIRDEEQLSNILLFIKSSLTSNIKYNKLLINDNQKYPIGVLEVYKQE